MDKQKRARSFSILKRFDQWIKTKNQCILSRIYDHTIKKFKEKVTYKKVICVCSHSV